MIGAVFDSELGEILQGFVLNILGQGMTVANTMTMERFTTTVL